MLAAGAGQVAVFLWVLGSFAARMHFTGLY